MPGRITVGLLTLIANCACAADPVTLWLVVTGSDPGIVPAIARKQQLQRDFPQASIVASSDCDNLAPDLYLTVAATANDQKAAQAVLNTVAPGNTGASLRECRPKAASRLALAVPLVDPSIERVPQDAVNWSDEDRISTVHRLSEHDFVWIRRRYEPAPEDSREGRREAILFFTGTPGAATELDPDCSDASFAQSGNRLAVSCARETAAEHLLHETKVYETPSGRSLAELRRCRRPEFRSSTQVICQEEAVDGEGELRLRPKELLVKKN